MAIETNDNQIKFNNGTLYSTDTLSRGYSPLVHLAFKHIEPLLRVGVIFKNPSSLENDPGSI
jgi:hypothetical protein